MSKYDIHLGVVTRKVIVAFTLGGSAGLAGYDIGTASMRHFLSTSVIRSLILANISEKAYDIRTLNLG